MAMTLENYLKIKAKLTAAQAEELAARNEMVAAAGHTKVGSKTITFDSGAKVSVTNTVNITIDESQLPTVKEKLENDLLYYSVFVPKPSFSATVFKTLTNEQKEIVEEALISKAGQAQFKVVKLAGGVDPV